MPSLLTSPSPVTCPCQTIRRGRVESAEARTRWLRRPTPRHGGWHRAILDVNGIRYDVSCFFTADDDTGHVWQVLDLVKQDLGDHYRLTIGPDGVLCDCPHATYRGVVCKHAAAVTEALDQLDRLEQAERLLDEAQAALDALEAVGPPPADFDPFTVELDLDTAPMTATTW
jgi:hypothetical protein